MANKSSQKSSHGSKDTAHIPSHARYPTLQMTAAIPLLGNHPTIFVGLLDDTRFTNDKWNIDVRRVADSFQISDTNNFLQIKIARAAPGEVDAHFLDEEFRKAMQAVNRADMQFLRIVPMGIEWNEALFKYLELLIRQWNIPFINKQVQYVVSGDTADYQHFNFCKGLCMQEICHSLQYYHTLDYDQDGNFVPNMILAVNAKP